ncbi:hypothetical protein KC324_g18482 [Hortaea werneckii]|nr:hypothetical protein KC324_g18482 [Hortaea werneckii]
MNRASNYMTLAFVKLPSLVLCLSYKGSGKRNLEDVHDLVFRMPTLEYRNKTWSNLDLALQLKKDLIRALVSHTGAILTNKFSHHKPTRQQQTRLREIANMSTFVASGATSQASSESSSMLESFGDSNGRPSMASARPSTLNRSVSVDSTPARSDREQKPGQDEDKTRDIIQSNGRDTSPSPQRTPSRPMSQPAPSPGANGEDASRSRASSISRHFSGFSERLRQRPTTQPSDSQTTSGGEETEDTKRKSKLLLGGQKLFRSFRDQ